VRRTPEAAAFVPATLEQTVNEATIEIEFRRGTLRMKSPGSSNSASS
jgi:hypothetical protein